MTKKQEEEPKVVGIAVEVTSLPDGPCNVEVRYDRGEPGTTAYDLWRPAIYAAYVTAHKNELVEIELVFTGTQHSLYMSVPEEASELTSKPMNEVERQIARKGFETGYLSGGKWKVHQPDAAVGTPDCVYRPRGYFTQEQMIALATSTHETIVEEIQVSSEANGSSTRRYLHMRGARNMAKKTEVEETKKVRATAKSLNGVEVEISPKQEEMLELIRKRSASGNPVGSDPERLDDPSSIAAMKLATNEVVTRGKFGTRWWYFANAKDLAAAVAAAEKAAEEEAAAKKKPAKAAPAKAAAGSAAAASGKKVAGRLKKPSEK